MNQAAEQIVFAANEDATVTAVIQIMYEGPSEQFSWILPIAGVPSSIGVASNSAFGKLQSASNPRYSLTTRVEGTCHEDLAESGSAGAGGEGPSSGDPGVHVEASGVVGAFDWSVISLDAGTSDPAAAAVSWLGDNGYDVPSSAPGLLGPYLADGLNLLALKLTKGADTGSIRPIVVTYPGTKPSIPIKLTAVAANADMGVLVWVLGNARAIPQNYYALELDEALINWFNPGPTYGAVVTAAANDAGGQGFVTEFAGPASTFADTVWSSDDERGWQEFAGGQVIAPGASSKNWFDEAYYRYGGLDGFWDVVKQTVTLPTNLTLDTLKSCPYCHSAELTLDPQTFTQALDDSVVEPLRAVQAIIAAHPTITRLYTTLSADEMTADPLFAFNSDLPDVSNVHVAERVIECRDDIYQNDANWRVLLPQGGVVRGTSEDAARAAWPASNIPGLPPNLTISTLGETGSGHLIEDNSAAITKALTAFNATVPPPPTVSETGSAGTSGTSGTGGTGGTDGPVTGSGGKRPANRGGTGGGSSPSGQGGEPSSAGEAGGPASTPGAGHRENGPPASGCACQAGGSRAPRSWGWLGAALALGLTHRQRLRGGSGRRSCPP